MPESVAKRKDQERKEVIGISFDPAVVRALDKYAETQRVSRSWLVNEIIREKCGIIPEMTDED